jgi:hypothetical protein
MHADVLRASKVFVEFEPQTRIEGDLQQMDASFAVTELWLVLTGQLKGRDNAEQITLFDSVGFAMEDFSALRYVYDTARAMALGDAMTLIPPLANPKDLFSALQLPSQTDHALFGASATRRGDGAATLLSLQPGHLARQRFSAKRPGRCAGPHCQCCL